MFRGADHAGSRCIEDFSSEVRSLLCMSKTDLIFTEHRAGLASPCMPGRQRLSTACTWHHPAAEAAAAARYSGQQGRHIPSAAFNPSAGLRVPVHAMQAVRELSLPHGIVQPLRPLLLRLALGAAGIGWGGSAGGTRGPLGGIAVVIIRPAPVTIRGLAADGAGAVAAQPPADRKFGPQGTKMHVHYASLHEGGQLERGTPQWLGSWGCRLRDGVRNVAGALIR